MRAIFLLLTAFIFSLPITAQPVKGSDNTLNNTNPAYVNQYRRIDHYLVDSRTPVKTVQLCFNIFVDPASLPDTTHVRNELKQTLAWINGWYSNVSPPTDSFPGVERVTDTKIRFEVRDRIYFYQNAKLYKSCYTTELEKAVKTTDSTRLNYLNVYFSYGPCTQHAAPPYPGFDYYGASGSWKSNLFALIPITEVNYATAQALAHELGHTLDLMHTYEASCCHETCDANSPEYLDDLFGTTPNKNCWHDGGWSCDPNSSSNKCTNNMMGGVATVSYYFSPKQIAKMHRALSVKSAKKYVKETGTRGSPIIIKGEEVWDFDMRVYGDIIVKKKSKLIIKGNITLPENAKVVVKRRGKLEMQGGKLVKSTTGEAPKIRRK
jgi:hypothetical protein